MVHEAIRRFLPFVFAIIATSIRDETEDVLQKGLGVQSSSEADAKTDGSHEHRHKLEAVTGNQPLRLEGYCAKDTEGNLACCSADLPLCRAECAYKENLSECYEIYNGRVDNSKASAWGIWRTRVDKMADQSSPDWEIDDFCFRLGEEECQEECIQKQDGPRVDWERKECQDACGTKHFVFDWEKSQCLRECAQSHFSQKVEENTVCEEIWVKDIAPQEKHRGFCATDKDGYLSCCEPTLIACKGRCKMNLFKDFSGDCYAIYDGEVANGKSVAWGIWRQIHFNKVQNSWCIRRTKQACERECLFEDVKVQNDTCDEIWVKADKNRSWRCLHNLLLLFGIFLLLFV